MKTTPAPEKSSWRNGYRLLALLVLVIGGSGVWFMTSGDNSSNEVNTEMSMTVNSNDAKKDFGKNENIENTNIATAIEATPNTKNEMNISGVNNDKFATEKIESSISNF